MFIHKSKPLIVPQRNHAHLAGNLAAYWGNDKFDLPIIPLETVVKGITFHQNGYDLIDVKPVKQMTDDELVEVFKNDFYVDLQDNDAELINMFHQYRLVSGRVETDQSQVFVALKNEFRKAMDVKLAKSQFSENDFLWANRITHLCDKLSFNFCFGNESPEKVELFQSVISTETITSVHVLEESTIHLDPWPFSTDKIISAVVAYEKDDYPNTLMPQLLTLSASPQVG
jgi:hypothetical protein